MPNKRTVNGVTLSYEEAGEEMPSLALLHGFPLDGRMWAGVAAEVTARWRVCVPDLRGFGQSFDPDRADAPFSIEDLADDVHALLAEIGMLPCVLAGTSMGGYVALAFARKYRSDLLGLGLVDTQAAADTPQAKAKRGEVIGLASRMGTAAVVGRVFPETVLDPHGPMAGPLRQMMTECPTDTVRHALAAMRDRKDYTDVLATLSIPTAVIVGRHDKITPLPLAEAMAAALPDCRLTVVEDAGHMAPVEQPAAVSEAIQGLMERCGG